MTSSPDISCSKSLFTLCIAVPCPLYRTFNYLPIPDLNVSKLKPGLRVKVPFGTRKLIGVFIKTEIISHIPIKKLKPIFSLLDEKPIFSQKTLNLLTWLSTYYHYPIGEVLALAMPAALKKGEPISSLFETAWTLSQTAQEINLHELKKAIKQAEILKFLQEQTVLTELDVTSLNFSRSSLQQLIKKDLIKKIQIKPSPKLNISSESPLVLNDEQNRAFQTIKANLNTFNVFLLQGITGSGKTEIYFHIIDKIIKQKRQVLVLVPEIGLTPQMLDRFQRRFTAYIGILHSSLTNKQKLMQWYFAQENQLDIIIGTRSAIYSPLNNLGLIIIDEEHDQSFKQQDTLRYSARDTAIIYAKLLDIPIILGSATPSLESYYNSQQKRYFFISLTQRAAKAQLPTIKLVDIRNQTLREGLSPIVISTIKAHLRNNNQVLVFLNRRGFSPKLICHSCGYLFQCKNCDAHHTYHQKDNKLICHHCEYQQKLPKTCPKCQSSCLVPLGHGTERIEIFLSKIFHNYQIIRIDRDTTRKKGSLSQFLNEIKNNKFQILIGTQMLTKGHHFPNITLSVIIDTDSGLFSEDLRALERLGQLITQTSGRSGRGEKPGEVLIQTRQPTNPLYQYLLQHDYFSFLDNLLQQRKSAQMPPFAYLALFRAESTVSDKALYFLNHIKNTILLNNSKTIVLGPVTAPISRKANKFRYQILLKATNRTALQSLLTNIIKNISESKLTNRVKWSLDVDPIDFF